MIKVARKLDGMRSSIVASMFALAGMGCGVESTNDQTSDNDFESTSQAIVGGEKTTDYAAVGALTQRGSSFCTGTLIGKRLVVTAAHCLQGVRPSNVRFALGPRAATPQVELGVSRVIAHPKFDATRITNDIGVLILSDDAPIAPMAVNESMSSNWVGRPLMFVGYGVTSGLTKSGGGVKRSARIAVSKVGSTQFSYEDDEKNTCFGDSGGPAFAKDSDGNLSLVGVTSYGDRGCRAYGVDTRVDVYRDFFAAAEQHVAPDTPGMKAGHE